jgi:sterol-4alpha-carboxylate 3-dehydrogenase (decarboxylating)
MAPIPPHSKKALGTVLITGGCGFLGHHIVKLLLDSYSCKIAVVDLRTLSNRPSGSESVKYFDCDVTNTPTLLKIFEEVKPDVVIHTASPNGNDNKASYPIYYKVNVDGTKAIIEACQQTNVKALVYTCSASIISDNQGDIINADERWPVLRGKAQPDYYSETKVRHNDYLCGIEG